VIEGMSVYKVDETWAHYGYREYYTRWYGKDTGEKIITKWGEFVRTASDDYVLLPNEVVRELVDDIAADIGAEKVSEEEDRWRIYLLYDLKNEYTIDDKTVQLGFYVQNSVDGSLSFAANVQSLLGDPRKGRARIMFPYGFKTLSPILAVGIYRRRHKIGEMDKDREKLRNDLISVIRRAEESVPLFKFWMAVGIDREDAKYLCDNIPAIYLPKYVKAMSEGITLTEMISVWDVVIDVSKAIWSGDCGFTRKYKLYGALLRAAEKKRP